MSDEVGSKEHMTWHGRMACRGAGQGVREDAAQAGQVRTVAGERPTAALAPGMCTGAGSSIRFIWWPKTVSGNRSCSLF